GTDAHGEHAAGAPRLEHRRRPRARGEGRAHRRGRRTFGGGVRGARGGGVALVRGRTAADPRARRGDGARGRRASGNDGRGARSLGRADRRGAPRGGRAARSRGRELQLARAGGPLRHAGGGRARGRGGEADRREEGGAAPGERGLPLAAHGVRESSPGRGARSRLDRARPISRLRERLGQAGPGGGGDPRHVETPAPGARALGADGSCASRGRIPALRRGGKREGASRARQERRPGDEPARERRSGPARGGGGRGGGRAVSRRFDGRVAVVTGGAKGIGLAISRGFAAEGASVVLSGRDGEALERAASEIKSSGGVALAVTADAAAAGEAERLCEATLAAFGKADILVNNAGVTRDGLLLRMSDDDWDL